MSLDKKAEELLERGYGEMAQLNLELAEEAVCADNEALDICVVKLTESE